MPVSPSLRFGSLIALALFSACAATKTVPTPNGVLTVATDVEHAEGSFVGDEHLKLYYQSWRPKAGPTRATLVVMHGLEDYSGRYAALADLMVHQGFAVYGFDLPGHGLSEGERAYVDSFNEYLDDVGTFLKLVREKEPGKPLFIFGHSMGGAVVTLFTLARHPELQGLALSGPALMPGSDVSGALIRVTKMLGSVAPHLGVLDLDRDAFSRDPAVKAGMAVDPLVYQGKGAARTAAELLRAMAAIQEHEEELTVPLFVMQGTDDKLVNPEGGKRLVEKASSKDKTLKLYEGYYHDLLHEPEKAQIAADLSAWLVAHLLPVAPVVGPVGPTTVVDPTVAAPVH